VDFLSVLALRYVAPVTLFMEKREGVPREEFLAAQAESAATKEPDQS
jgi:hypothetical protein